MKSDFFLYHLILLAFSFFLFISSIPIFLHLVKRIFCIFVPLVLVLPRKFDSNLDDLESAMRLFSISLQYCHKLPDYSLASIHQDYFHFQVV